MEAVLEAHASRDGQRSSILGALTGTLATDGGLMLLGVVSGSLTARLLQPEGRGALTATLLWPQFLAGVGMLSLNEATAFRIAAGKSVVQRTVRSSLTLGLLLAVLTTVLSFVAIPFLLPAKHIDVLLYSHYYLLALVPAQFVTLTTLAVAQGKMQFRRFNFLRMGTQAFYLVGLLVLMRRGNAELPHIVTINGLSVLAVGVLAWWRLRPEITAVPDWAEIKGLLRLCLRFHPIYLIGICVAQLDQIVALFVWDSATLGNYAIALTVATSGFGLISAACCRVLFPMVAEARTPTARSLLIAKTVRHAMLLTVSLLVPCAISTPFLIKLLFGGSYSPSVLPAMMLLPAQMVAGLRAIVDQLLRGCGEGKPGILAGGLNLLTLAFLAPILAKWKGMPGMAVAVGCGSIAALSYFVWYLDRRMSVPWQSLWGLNRETVDAVRLVIREAGERVRRSRELEAPA